MSGIRPGQAKGPWVGSVIAPGEVTAGANVGVGEGEIFRDITSHMMNFRKLKSGLGITILTDGDVVRISSTEYSDVYWLNPVISIYDNTSALPPAPSDGDRYIALVTANGWTINHVYEWDDDLSDWTDTAPLDGMTLRVLGQAAILVYTGSVWTTPWLFGTGDPPSATGLVDGTLYFKYNV